MDITLRRVTHANFEELADLAVREDQREFVASNAVSIMEAYTTLVEGGVALPFGIYAGDTPVGFLMIGYDCLDWEDAPAVARGAYCLWRLMIDARYQPCNRRCRTFRPFPADRRSTAGSPMSQAT